MRWYEGCGEVKLKGKGGLRKEIMYTRFRLDFDKASNALHARLGARNMAGFSVVRYKTG